MGAYTKGTKFVEQEWTSFVDEVDGDNEFTTETR
jgi:hypothetical protein